MNRHLQMAPSRVDHYLHLERDGGRTPAAFDVDPLLMASLNAELGLGDYADHPSDAWDASQGDSSGSTSDEFPRRPPAAMETAPARSWLQTALDVGQSVFNSAHNAFSCDGASNARSTELEIVVGNRCEREQGAERNQFNWTMYVALPGVQNYVYQGSIIERVSYHLHPTSTPSTVTCTAAPFEITRSGWGTFPVTCVIYWHPELDMPRTEVVHNLDFRQGGARTTARATVILQRLDLFR